MIKDKHKPTSHDVLSHTIPQNYSTFIELLKQRLSTDDPRKKFLALLFIEFDDLTRFNDIFGFSVDEQLAKILDQKLIPLLKKEDALARVCNSQYVIMRNLSSSKSPEVLANDIFHLLSEPFVVDDQMFYMNASIGISISPIDGENAYRLIKASQSAMNRAQKNGSNHFELAHNAILPSYEKSVHIMADLPAAIENGEIDFSYQPQYSSDKKCFTGAEMLARWEHPEYGMISPELFIPLAEKNGMIASLTVKALISASKAFTLLEENGIEDFSLSVNISPAFLMTKSFHETVAFITKEYRLNKRSLNLEITEEVLMQGREHLCETLEKVRALGLKIELDDFGTGHTSLQHLAYLPIDTLKIDRSFVSGIGDDRRKRALFKAIVEMCHALDIGVIAEGIEQSSEDQIVQSFDSIISQGYFYSKPLSLDVLIKTVSTP